MGQKFNVQAVTRPGHDGAWRAGRKWPAGSPVAVEVLEQDDDPPDDPAKGVRIGKQTYEALKADRHLTIRAPGDPLETAKDHDALVAQVAALQARLAKYEAADVGKTETTKVEHRDHRDHREGPSTEGVMTEAEATKKRR